MIKVHHLNNSRPQPVLWMLEELGRPSQVVRYGRDARTMLAPAALRAAQLASGRWSAVARSSCGAGARAESG